MYFVPHDLTFKYHYDIRIIFFLNKTICNIYAMCIFLICKNVALIVKKKVRCIVEFNKLLILIGDEEKQDLILFIISPPKKLNFLTNEPASSLLTYYSDMFLY